MPELIITRGLPASGKTTWAKKWVAADPDHRARVNRDDLRAQLFDCDGVLPRPQEEIVSRVQKATVAALLRGRKALSVVVDDTNLRAKYARAWADLAASIPDVEFRVQDFTDVPVEECIFRDAHRQPPRHREVGAKVILDMQKRYRPDRGLEDVVPSAVVEARQYNVADFCDRVGQLAPAYIFDVDGTLARMNGRSPYDVSRVSEDEPVWPVIDLAQTLHAAGFRIVVVSGRVEAARVDTERWLDDVGLVYDRLFMRADGDHRNDAVIKPEIFWRDIAPNYDVRGAFDDRDRVVHAWRGIGLLCCQVAEGDF